MNIGELSKNTFSDKDKPIWEYELLPDGNARVTAYNGGDTDVVVPAEIDGHTVVSIRGMSRYFLEELHTRSVTLPDTLREIGRMAFSNLKRLETIKLPDSLESIGDSAFWHCESLERPVIPESVKQIAHSAFLGCRSMADKDGFVIVRDTLYDYFGIKSDITVPDNVKIISRSAFTDALRTDGVGTAVKLPDGLEEIMDAAFAGGINLKSINIPPSVRHIGDHVFYHCKGLADSDGFVVVNGVLYDYVGEKTDVVVPEGVTGIDVMAFAYNEFITSVKLPESVKDIPFNAFSCCRSLADENGLVIVDGVLYKVFDEYVRHRHYGVLTIPSGVTEIRRGAFDDTKFVRHIKMPDPMPKIEDGTFLDRINLGDGDGFVIFDGILYAYVGIDEEYWDEDDFLFDESMVDDRIIIPEGVREIGYCAFAGWNEITSVELPDTVKKIGVGAFRGCTSLTRINLDCVEEIGEDAFLHCPVQSEAKKRFPAV